MAFEFLTVECEGGIATVTINRPAVLNALSSGVLKELGRAMADLRDDAGVRVVILTGAGEKAFVAGADIRELAELPPVAAQAYAAAGQRVFAAIEQMGKPVIAAVNGFALGGGCELAMACTMRVAADTAKFGQPEIALGLIPGFGGTQRLPRLVGKGRAMELILTGGRIDAAEAHRIGLVNRVVPAAALMTEVRTLAQALAGSAPVAMRLALEAVNNGLEMSTPDACAFEATAFGLVFSSEDMREGTRAFVEKRKATFTGR